MRNLTNNLSVEEKTLLTEKLVFRKPCLSCCGCRYEPFICFLSSIQWLKLFSSLFILKSPKEDLVFFKNWRNCKHYKVPRRIESGSRRRERFRDHVHGLL